MISALIISEARYTSSQNQWFSDDGAHDDQQWRRYGRPGVRLIVAGRATAGHPRGAPIETAEVFPLRSYDGLTGTLRGTPKLVHDLRAAIQAADIVFLRCPGHIANVAALLCRGVRKPYVAEVIGDPGAVLRSGIVAAGPVLAPVAETLNRRVVRNARAVRYVTQADLQQRYPAADDVPTFAISNVRLNDEAFVPAPRSARPATTRIRLIAIGSQQNTYKAHDDAIRATRILCDQGFEASLTLVGGGRTQDSLKSLADSLGCAERVVFAGQVNDRQAIIRMLDEADIQVHPSRTEGLPRAVLEGMARALPVIATNVGGTPEIVPDSCLVSPNSPEALAASVERAMSPACYRQFSVSSLDTARQYAARRLDTAFAEWLDTAYGVVGLD